MTVTFHNVTITLEAATPREAYDALCELLDQYNKRVESGIEWETDTYCVDDGEPRETSELWPADEQYDDALREVVDQCSKREESGVESETKEPIDIVCSACGSKDVRRDAFAEWNAQTQAWELSTVFDQGYCEDCEGEARLDEVPRTTSDAQ